MFDRENGVPGVLLAQLGPQACQVKTERTVSLGHLELLGHRYVDWIREQYSVFMTKMLQLINHPFFKKKKTFGENFPSPAFDIRASGDTEGNEGPKGKRVMR